MPTLLQNLKSMPRTAWILFGGTFINRFGSFVIVILMLYMTRNGYSVAEAGIAVAFYGVGHLLASLIGGYLADRLGRRPTIVLSMFSSGLSVLALSTARGLPAIIFCTALVGLTSELYRPATSALLADLLEPEQRVTGFALYRLAVNLGFALGPAAAGFLADRSFTILFVGDAVTSMIYGLIAFFALPKTLPPGRDSGEETRGAIGFILRDRGFLLFLVASAAVTFIYFQAESTFPVHVSALGHPSSTYGLLLSLNGLLIVLFELLITAWTQRMRAAPLIAIGYVVVGAGFMANAIDARLWPLVLCIVLWTLGEMISAPLASAYVAQMAPVHMRGRYMGAWGFSWALGMILGPAIGSALYGDGSDRIWYFCGLLGMFAAALVLLSSRIAERGSIAALAADSRR